MPYEGGDDGGSGEFAGTGEGAGEGLVTELAGFARQWDAAHDPVIAAIVTLHMRTFATLLAGARGRHLSAPEPLISAGFESSAEECHRVRAVSSREGQDVLHLTFELDTQEMPSGLFVARREKAGVRLYSRAWPWMPPRDDRAVIATVFGEQLEQTHLRLRRASRMTSTPGWPTKDISSGVSRAADAWRRVLASSAKIDPSEIHLVARSGGAGVPHLRLAKSPIADEPVWQVSLASERDAADEEVVRKVCCADPAIATSMGAFATALAIGMAGRGEPDSPAPLFQAGFEPVDDHERRVLATRAVATGRDLVQVSFDPSEPNQPTGILVIQRDPTGQQVLARAVPWMRTEEGEAPLVLIGDGEPARHFVLTPGGRLESRQGGPEGHSVSGENRARAAWEELSIAIFLRNRNGGPLRRYVQADDAGGVLVRTS